MDWKAASQCTTPNAMFKLAHFSDIHLGPLPDVTFRQLASKRVTGYINWRRNRRLNLDHGIIDRITDDMLAQEPDHVALTGDLVNLALDKEIEAAKLWLEGLSSPENVTVVPGNHDAYVPGALDKAVKAWGSYMAGDGKRPPKDRHAFPFVRERGPIALVGVSSARATAPFLASGYFTKKQAKATRRLLEEAGKKGLFRVVMIHHPPIRGATGAHKRLYGIRRFQKMIRKVGAELVLHGHTHLPTVHHIEGPEGANVPVVGVAAAGQAHGGSKPPAHYNLFEIDGEAGNWSIRHSRRGATGKGEAVAELYSQVIA